MPLLATATSIDSGLVTELVNLAKTAMSLFAEFPLNVILIGSLIGVAFGIISRAKNTAK